jgi:mono/diheme cytochrome c family protein
MTRWPIAVMVSLLALALFAYGAAAKAGNAEHGKQLYEDNCMSCHGSAGEGKPAMYKKAKAKIVHLGSEEAQKKSDDSIRKAIMEGVGKMDKVEELVTPQQVDDVIAYVRALRIKK